MIKNMMKRKGRIKSDVETTGSLYSSPFASIYIYKKTLFSKPISFNVKSCLNLDGINSKRECHK
jgi:hypothetical protein